MCFAFPADAAVSVQIKDPHDYPFAMVMLLTLRGLTSSFLLPLLHPLLPCQTKRPINCKGLFTATDQARPSLARPVCYLLCFLCCS
jgi:hypothetical protein